MRRGKRLAVAVAAACTFATLSPLRILAATPSERATIEAIVGRAVAPVMRRYGIPGMAVGVTAAGRHDVFAYGVASKATGARVGRSTLFEIGSISKTFTATLAAYAQETGRLRLGDRAGADFPPLRGTSFDRISLRDLGTHTAGGLPLQFPDAVRSDADAMAYYRTWKPTHPAGAYRLYSNTGIMLLGAIAARRLDAPFELAMRRDVLDPLGLRDTVYVVPPASRSRYAQGYTDAGKPRRMIPGPLAAEAYGVRTTAPDLLRFVEAEMGLVATDATLRRTIDATQIGYVRVGAMTQDLIWEQYRYPTSRADLVRGNSPGVVFEDDRATRLDPPARPGADVLIDKTGSTAGFGAYVAFVPRRKIGVVLLANRSYPLEARVVAGYEILSGLARIRKRPPRGVSALPDDRRPVANRAVRPGRRRDAP